MELEHISLRIIKEKFSKISEPAGGVGYRVDHAIRVANYLKVILNLDEIKKLNLDKSVIISAGLLHDMGDIARVQGNSICYTQNIDHAKVGGGIIIKELKKYHVDSDMINRIVEIIINHHEYDMNQNNETKLIQDADTLDELGVLNIWQMFNYSANKGRTLRETIEYWSSEGIARKKCCVELCNFEFSKKWAQARFNEMQKFFSYMDKEVAGTDLTIS